MASWAGSRPCGLATASRARGWLPLAGGWQHPCRGALAATGRPCKGGLDVASRPLAGGLGRNRLPLAASHDQPLLLSVLAANAEIVYPCILDPDGEDEGGQASSSLAVSTRWISTAKLFQSDFVTLAQREGEE
ncbi:hypothetical protein GW17_00053369 [Ensete ventricosum]|nr:hypothetical protein GW17_00053369 [Ensete ventricosum]